MALDLVQERRQAHAYLDHLPPEQLSAVRGLLETMLDREQIADEEEGAVHEAKQWLRDNGGKGIPHEEVLADFGLTMDDFRRMGEERARRRAG